MRLRAVLAMNDFPLTPGEAIVLATFLEEHAKLPHLVALVGRLRTWARTPTAATEEGEMPSQTGFPGSADGTLGDETEAVPEVRKHRGDLTASTSTELTGGRGL
jgi:hypothetical protein